ncbi:HNH endonuclease [Flexivirga meconopsidis]|uniref:HNH endonuclease n=1 Tax=Flexivirga meconopsidis TaxID=2977121 RepID=UPI00223EB486|nr:HNH endonuclease [Flexivirga meconopsidis]
MVDEVIQQPGAEGAVLDAAAVRQIHDRLDARPKTDTVAACLEEVRALQELRNAISARQAELTLLAHELQAAADKDRGIAEQETTRVVASQVGLARRTSPRNGSRLVALAQALTDMPRTMQALRAGVIGEWQATLVTRETIFLSAQDRAEVDAQVADQLGTASDRHLERAARAAAYRVDPGVAAARRAKAVGDRRVTLRPAPDAMTWLTAHLPVQDGLACMAALNGALHDRPAPADAPAKSMTRGQRMADTFVERLTGRSPARGADVEVQLLMPISTLTADEPAVVPGYGPVPADLAREMVGGAAPATPPRTQPDDPPRWRSFADHLLAQTGADAEPQPGRRVHIRRVFTHPSSGDLIGMDSRSRTYPGLLAQLIGLRDQICRTPWCGAPIAHTDHIRPHSQGGPTSERNGAGLCAQCNYAKEHPDFEVVGDAAYSMTTSGGVSAASRPPRPPEMSPPTRSPIERELMELTWRHDLTRRRPPPGPGASP